MEDKIKVAGEIAAHTYPLSEKSLCRLAAILEPRKLLKNELFLKEGDVARSMGVVEQGMVRQFYRKKNLEITEHRSRKSSVQCITPCSWDKDTNSTPEIIFPQ